MDEITLDQCVAELKPYFQPLFPALPAGALDVYCTIFLKGPRIKQTAIARQLEKSPPYVGRLIEELISEGLVTEVEEGASGSLFLLVNPESLFYLSFAKSADQFGTPRSDDFDRFLRRTRDERDWYSKTWHEHELGIMVLGEEERTFPIQSWTKHTAAAQVSSWINALGSRLNGAKISCFTPHASVITIEGFRRLLAASIKASDCTVEVFVDDVTFENSDKLTADARDFLVRCPSVKSVTFEQMPLLSNHRQRAARERRFSTVGQSGMTRVAHRQWGGVSEPPSLNSFPLAEFLRIFLLDEIIGYVVMKTKSGYAGSAIYRDAEDLEHVARNLNEVKERRSQKEARNRLEITPP